MLSLMNERARYLLDTHTWLWLVAGDSRITPETATLLDLALTEERVFLCQISVWELAMKETGGKLLLNRPLNTWLKENTNGIGLLDMSIEVAIDATRLPGEFHKDQADRIIVATARHHGLTLVTGDGLLHAYAKNGHVQVHPI